jgi:hypothetical protein
MQSLPGNQQTLRNYCAHLRKTEQVMSPPVEARLCNYIESPPPGVQIQLDYGVQIINGGEHVHFLCIRMRYSRLLFVRVQDHLLFLQLSSTPIRFLSGYWFSVTLAFFPITHFCE